MRIRVRYFFQRKSDFQRGFELLIFSLQMPNRPHAGFAVFDLDPRLFNLHKYEAPYYTLLEMSVWPTAVFFDLNFYSISVARRSSLINS